MNDLDQLLGFYTQLIGVNGGGDRQLDDDLATFAGLPSHDENSDPVPFTTSMDAATAWMETVLKGWQIHTMHRGLELWNCELVTGDPIERATGTGRSAAVAILSATVVALISKRLVHWNLEPRPDLR